MDATLPKERILRSQKEIAALFAQGDSFVCHPLRVCWLPAGGEGVRILVSVPKRHFKRAVRRNLLKRRIREAFRLLRGTCPVGADVAFVYIDREILPFETLFSAMQKALSRIAGQEQASRE